MKKIFVTVCLLITVLVGHAQDVFGKWKTIDDQTGKARSIVEIYERDGKVFGRIIDILDPNEKVALCEKCEGEFKNKPVLGFELIQGLTKSGKYYKNGTIFDPEHGREFNCRIGLDDKNTDILQVRGYISFLYATQYWQRVK